MVSLRTPFRAAAAALILAPAAIAPPLMSPAPAKAASSATATTASADVERIFGADRYATAAALAATWSPGVSTLFVASGQSSTDPLVASSRAAVFDAPLLLTRSDSLPSVTVEAINRLQPGKIVIVGGHGAVTEKVADELAGLTAGNVARINGANDYDTAANAAKAYSPGVRRVVLANGEDYPDALAAAALSGWRKEPILLTRQGDLPPVTARQLERLAPTEIIVVGGTTAVSEAVAQAAASYTTSGKHTRLAGSDRYGTAAAVAGEFPTSSTTGTYVASGTEAPDALVSAAAAARDEVPVLLTKTDRLPTATENAVTQLEPTQIQVVGGPAVVSEQVIDALRGLGDSNPAPPVDPDPTPPAVPGFGAGVYNGMAQGEDEAFEDLTGFDQLTHGSSYYNPGQVGPNNWPIARDMQRIEDGKTVLMGMASKNWNKGGPNSFMSWSEIANGRHDAEIRGWAQRLAEIDKEIWFAWDIEPDVKLNQGLVPSDWTPEQFAAAARRISTIMGEEAPKVRFTFWVGGHQKEMVKRMYPGDDFVDIICWDPYVTAHRSPDATPQQVWGDFKNWLDQQPFGKGKTIGLCETGFHNGHPDAKGAAFWDKAPAAIEELGLSFVFYFHSNSGPNGNYTMDNRPLSRTAYARAMEQLVP